VGELVALSSFSERRRSREARRLHAACRDILAGSIEATRLAVAASVPAERAVQLRRLRKLEEAQAYAEALG